VPTSHDVHRELIRELYVAFTPISMPVSIVVTFSCDYTGTYLSHRLSNGYAPPKLLG
jgi:hypothetical protein